MHGDFRLEKPLRQLLAAWGIATWDAVRLAGGAVTLTRDATTALVLQQLQLSLRLHRPRSVILTVHRDCGAMHRFASAAQEDAELLAVLAAAERIAGENLMAPTVRTFIVDPDRGT